MLVFSLNTRACSMAKSSAGTAIPPDVEGRGAARGEWIIQRPWIRPLTGSYHPQHDQPWGASGGLLLLSIKELTNKHCFGFLILIFKMC